MKSLAQAILKSSFPQSDKPQFYSMFYGREGEQTHSSDRPPASSQQNYQDRPRLQVHILPLKQVATDIRKWPRYTHLWSGAYRQTATFFNQIQLRWSSIRATNRKEFFASSPTSLSSPAESLRLILTLITCLALTLFATSSRSHF